MDRQTSVRRWGAIAASVLAIVVTSGTAGAQQGTGSRGETQPPPTVIEVSRERFDWQDAGVGAAASLALVAIGFGLTLVVRNRPDPK